MAVQFGYICMQNVTLLYFFKRKKKKPFFGKKKREKRKENENKGDEGVGIKQCKFMRICVWAALFLIENGQVWIYYWH